MAEDRRREAEQSQRDRLMEDSDDRMGGEKEPEQSSRQRSGRRTLQAKEVYVVEAPG
jgi:hypothetical protein